MTDAASLAQRIETIESGYEFMLAYAAQGREDEQAGGPGPRIRDVLGGIQSALDGLAAAVNSEAGDFLAVLEDDAAKACAAVRFVLAQPSISSQLVDNLNASIHVRALLTDLFLLDEAQTN
jgi:hypothetical protein